MNRTSRATRATLLTTGFGYAAQALSVIAIPLYLRCLGAEGYGLIVTTMSFMGYLNFADAGLSWGSMILIGQANGRGDRALIGKIVRNSMVLATGSGTLGLAALGITLGLAAKGYRLPMFAGHPEVDALLAIAGIQLAVTLQAGVFHNLFQGLQEAYWMAFYQGLGRLVSIGSMMAVAWSTHSVWWVMLTQLAVTVISGGACAVHAWRKHPWVFQGGAWIDRTQLKLQLRTGLKVFLLQIGRTLTASAPVMAISSVIGPAAVPLYTVPTTLLQIVFMPLNAWSTSLQSAYGEAWESGNRPWVVDIFRNTLRRGLFWSACGAALFLPLAIPFVSLWTGGKLILPPLMPLAIVVIAFTSWFVMAGQYLLSGINRQRQVAVTEIISGALAIGVSSVAVKFFGVAGVGVGVLAPALVLSIRKTVREIKLHVSPAAFPSINFVARVFLILAVTGGAGCFFIIRTGGTDWMHQVVLMGTHGLLTLAFFCAISLLVRLDFVSEAVREIIRGIRVRRAGASPL